MLVLRARTLGWYVCVDNQHKDTEGLSKHYLTEKETTTPALASRFPPLQGCVLRTTHGHKE